MKKCPQCQNTYPAANAYCPRDGVALNLLEGLTPGTTIRRKYRVIEEIGSGGMGVVYRAEHILLKQECALKLINARYAGDPQVVHRFLAEAMMSNRIRHPNVVRVEDTDETEDGQPYVVMEYVAGKSLRQIMHTAQEAEPILLDPRRALDIACQVLAGLGAAHRMQIVHRDVKPDNILITTKEDGRDLVKIVDFGIAKAKVELLDTGVRTVTGMFIGTPQYCSPEHAKGGGGDEIDGRADIYSLGIVLYEMLTGWPPFSGAPDEILEQHQRTTPELPQAVRPELTLPEAITQVVMKALGKDPASRYSTAEEMIAALQRAGTGLHRVVAKPATINPTQGTSPRPVRRRTDPGNREHPVAPTPARPKFGSDWSTPSPRTSRSPRTWVLALMVLLVVFGGIGFFVYPRPPVDERTLVQQGMAAGNQAREQGLYDEAVRRYRQVLVLEPGNQAAKAGIEAAETAKRARIDDQLRAGEQFFNLGEYDNAVAAFQGVLDADPNNERAGEGILNAQTAKAAEEALNK